MKAATSGRIASLGFACGVTGGSVAGGVAGITVGGGTKATGGRLGVGGTTDGGRAGVTLGGCVATGGSVVAGGSVWGGSVGGGSVGGGTASGGGVRGWPGGGDTGSGKVDTTGGLTGSTVGAGVGVSPKKTKKPAPPRIASPATPAVMMTGSLDDLLLPASIPAGGVPREADCGADPSGGRDKIIVA
jgi:hypothetical protein